MSSPFIIDALKNNKFVVTWPAIHDIHGNETCFNLLKILFDVIKVGHANVFLSSMDNIMTISSEVWYSKSAHQYSEWLMSQYSIVGVLFDSRIEAEELQKILEKNYMWKILKS